MHTCLSAYPRTLIHTPLSLQAKAFLAEAERKQREAETALKKLEAEALAAAEREMEEGLQRAASRARW